MDGLDKEKLEKLNKYADRWVELAEYEGEDRVVSAEEARTYFTKEAPPLYNIKTGLYSLDDLTKGFRNGELISITGVTKNGKTSIAQTFTQNFWNREVKSLWFSYEVPGLQFINKFPVLPLFYLPLEMAESNLKWLERRVEEGVIKYGIKAVFIDHLHYLVPLSANVNMSLLIGGVMRELKKIALRHNVIMLIIAHTKKSVSVKKPGLEDLRDSSFIAQESDFVIAIQRQENESAFTRNSKLFLMANRWNGNLGQVYLKYENNIFYEISKEDYNG